MIPYRQGDVNLLGVLNTQGRLIAKGSYILARGEATGSVHTITGDGLEIYEHEGRIFLRVLAPAEITHTADHEIITIEPGVYRQVPEREMDHFAKVERKVVD